jgi:enamine deaminase RidA (YjgF/YER057c/UK114 family)
MTIRRIDPGQRFAAAVVANGMVYVSGQVPDTRFADVPTQTREILAKIERLLLAAGSNKSKLVSVNVWLRDIQTFDEMNRAWDEWVDRAAMPARATVESRIADPGYRVEIAAVAVL